MQENLINDLPDDIATEPEGDEVGVEIALERDPVTGEWREMKPEGSDEA